MVLKATQCSPAAVTSSLKVPTNFSYGQPCATSRSAHVSTRNTSWIRQGSMARIASSDKSDDVKTAARDLKARTEPSRAQIALLAIAALLVVALSGYEIFEHGRNAPRPAPPRPTIERITK